MIAGVANLANPATLATHGRTTLRIGRTIGMVANYVKTGIDAITGEKWNDPRRAARADVLLERAWPIR